MKRVSYKEIIDRLSELVIEISINMDPYIINLIRSAYESEDVSLSKNYLKAILDNISLAQNERLPVCQDTGINILFVKIGSEVTIDNGPFRNIEEIIDAGLAAGTKKGFLRESIVTPVERINTGDNTPSIVHLLPGERDEFSIKLMAKGFGSENTSRAVMLKPTSDKEDIDSFVIETVKLAGSSPCPPIFVGVGIGGSFEKAALLSKIALTKLNEISEQREWEEKLLKSINKLNIGAGGFGGNTTALDLRIELFPTHIAGLPVAVSISCWAHRMGELAI